MEKTAMAAQQTPTAKGAHLVGGLKAPDSESAMRSAAGILGRHLHALSDGETGERSQWIGWQLSRLMAIDGIAMAGTRRRPAAGTSEYNQDYAERPFLSVDSSVRELPARSLGYADAAKASYPVFRRLRDEGVIPPDVKFEVAIPTPYASVVYWIEEKDQQRFYPVYASAITREVAQIASAIDADDLLVQYDVAVEIGVLTGAFGAAGELGERRFIIDSLKEMLSNPAGGAERGLHLCYGDYRHRHFTVPKDLSLCVEVANGVGSAAHFVHMPADREAGRDPAYFAPLRALRAGPRLALGVIDYEGDEQRCRELVEAAATGSGGKEFAVATECGMARIDQRGPDSPSLERLLELHALMAAPIR